MAFEVGKLYFVSIKYPAPLNDPSPLKPQPPPVSHGWCSVSADSRNPKKGYGHVGLLLHYDETSKLGAVLLGTKYPRQPHRFVPWYGTPRLSSQPLVPLEPDPRGSFLEWPGYLNFTHAILVKVIGMSDPVYPTSPGMAIARDLVVDGDIVEIHVRPNQIAHLYALHSEYWMGTRYSDDSVKNPHGDDGGGTGGSGSVSTGDSGTGGSGTGGSGTGGSGTGGSGGRKLDTGTGGSGTGGSSDTENPVHPKTGLRHSTMVRLAMLQEQERFLQAQLMDGELDGEGVCDPLPCVLSPLTKSMLQELSDTKTEDSFPYELMQTQV